LKIIIKFLLNNIKEKKFRTFLIVFAITMSSALYFASNAMSTTINEMYMNIIKSYVGTAEVMVTPNDKSPSAFLAINKSDTIKEDVDYIIGSIQLSGNYKPEKGKDLSVNISLSGYDYEDLNKMNPLTLENALDASNFTGKKIIISRATADKYKLNLGDSIDLEINNNKYRFQIAGIAKIAGIFLSEKQNPLAVVPINSLYAAGEGRGKVSVLYVKTRDIADKQAVIDKLSAIYKNYSVNETVESEDLKQASDSVVVPLNMMGIVVLAMSIFIIYSAYKVITTERLPLVGTFRSIGATKKIMDMVLVGESIVYGILGGIFGQIVGLGVLYLMAMVVANLFGGAKIVIKFTPTQMLFSFILAVVLAVISSSVPIIKVSKIPIKDIVLNNVSKTEKKKGWRLYAGIIFILFAIIFPRIVPKKVAMLVDSISMLFLLIATLYLVPYVTKMFIKIFEKIYVHIFGNEGVLAVKNLRGNKSIMNNIALLAIAMSALLMINTISHSLAVEIPKIYKQWNFDVYIAGKDLNGDFLKTISNIKGVTDVNGVYSTNQVKIANSKDTIAEIDGIDKSKFSDYNKLKYLGDKNTMINELSLGRNIIVTKILRDKHNWKIGDVITLELNNSKKEYTIQGFVDSQWNNGSIAYISENYFKQDMNSKNYSYFAVKTKNSAEAEKVKKIIEQKYSKRGIATYTLQELTERNVKNNAQFMVLFNGFAIMAMIIGSFGIINNYMISFMERKRFIAMLRSIGMSKKQNIKILFIEALTGGIIGGITGIVSSILMISITPYLIEATSNFFIEMHYSLTAFLIAFIAAVSVTIIASVGPAFKSSKLNIIEAIKYE